LGKKLTPVKIDIATEVQENMSEMSSSLRGDEYQSRQWKSMRSIHGELSQRRRWRRSDADTDDPARDKGTGVFA